MSTNWADAPSASVVLPGNSNPVALPKGWTLASDSDALTIVCPERDLRCTFLILATGRNTEETSTAAWRQLDPAFERPVSAQGEVPSTEGWDKISQVVYNIPASESRVVFTVLRTVGNLAYAALVDGSKAAVSRRMAQVTEVLQLWKPAGRSVLYSRSQPRGRSVNQSPCRKCVLRLCPSAPLRNPLRCRTQVGRIARSRGENTSGFDCANP